MTTDHSRRRALGLLGAAGLGGVGALQNLPGAASTAAATTTTSWDITANGWLSQLTVDRRLNNGNPASVGGGYAATFIDKSSGVHQPVIAFRAGDGKLSFLRLYDAANASFQLYKTESFSGGLPRGSFYQYAGAGNNFTKTGPFSWSATSSFGSLDSLGLASGAVGQEEFWQLFYDGGWIVPTMNDVRQVTNFDLQWFWSSYEPLTSSAFGLTKGSLAVMGSRIVSAGVRAEFQQKPFTWIRPLGADFAKVEVVRGIERLNRLTSVEFGHHFPIGEVTWRSGISRVRNLSTDTNELLRYVTSATLARNPGADRFEVWPDPNPEFLEKWDDSVTGGW
ncbi:hypothetical protein [Streptomyces sp. SID13031]|uniref:hypothetical protein n=1 Tax=Streptomyces sp. SID13031 TaxID=2706046 RepID=UPI0013C5D3D2|nr:hypothetical protein [Streptomyces sp. SID13031]NEA34921.1 hypothetical protein [Streptomyces sp. SID13031]